MHLIVPHLFPPEHFLQAAVQGLRLPALETLVARGRRSAPPAVGLEGALCCAWGIARQRDWPWAALSREVDGGISDQAYWLRVDPVHLRIQRDRVILLGSELLNLPAEESAVLCADLHTHFGDAFHPLPLQPGRWYWRLDRDPQMETTPPSLAVGRSVETLLPGGPGAAQWRALLNEIQMLLARHPVNQQREARNLPVINSVWIWGGGHVAPAALNSSPFYCQDDHLRAIARHLGMATLAWTDKATELAPNALVLLDQLQVFGQYGDVLGWRAAAKELDETWLAALIRSGAAIQIEDPANGGVLDFQSQDRWKFWRRRRPLAIPQESLRVKPPPEAAAVDEFGNSLGK